MTMEQKFLAMKAIGDPSIKMNVKEEWYISLPMIDVKSGAMLSGVGSSAPSIEGAIDRAWNGLTNLGTDERIIIDAMGARREVKWNGFMWVDYK